MSMATRADSRSPARSVANGHDVIRVHGARVNNLKDISVEIPKRGLTVFTGVSGSGKSSLSGAGDGNRTRVFSLGASFRPPRAGARAAASRLGQGSRQC